MPGLEPGTTLLFNDWDTRYYSDNSLAAPLNWLYAPENDTPEMQYMFYYPEVRLGLGLEALEPGISIEQNYLAARFSGSTSQMVALNYSSSSCLRVLDPDLDVVNWMVPPLMQDAASLSNSALILSVDEQQAVRPMESIFGEEPSPSWCFYLAKAELARQMGDWDQVVSLGDKAFNLDDHPNDPSERLVYIEGYAHAGNWERAVELSWESEQVNEFMRPVLCELWKRIETTVTVPTGGNEDPVEEMRIGLECGDW